MKDNAIDKLNKRLDKLEREMHAINKKASQRERFQDDFSKKQIIRRNVQFNGTVQFMAQVTDKNGTIEINE